MDNLRSQLSEAKRFIEMAQASLDNEDYDKFKVRVAQIEIKLSETLKAIAAYKEAQEILK